MSTILPTPVLATSAPASATALTERSGAGPDVADVFAALVDALTAELAQAELPATEAETDADADAVAEPVADAAEELASAMPVAVSAWSLMPAVPPAPERAGAPPPAPPAAALSEVTVGGTGRLVADVAATASLPGAAGAEAGPTELVAAPARSGQIAIAPPVDIDADAGAVTDAGDASPPSGSSPARPPDEALAGAEVPPAAERDPAPAAAGQVVTGIGSTAETADASELRSSAQVRSVAPTLPDQLIEVIAPLRRGPDGTHQLSIQLRPDELGEVLVDVRVRGTEVNVSLRADLAGTTDLLREALGELRTELEAAGFRSADLDVGQHRSQERTQHHMHRSGATGADLATAPDDDQSPTPTTISAASGLDLRL